MIKNNQKNKKVDECTICTYQLCTSEKCVDEVLKNISNNKNLPENNKKILGEIKFDEIFIHDRNRNNTAGCGQKFHKKCILNWFEKSKTKSCPLCKGLVYSDDKDIISLFKTQNQNQNQHQNNNLNIRRNVFSRLTYYKDEFYDINSGNIYNERSFKPTIFKSYITALNPNELSAIDGNNNNILIVILQNFFEYDRIFMDCIIYLINNGIDINHTNNNNETALSIVYKNKNFDVLKLLIEKDANINININETPFIIDLLKTFSVDLLKTFSVIKGDITNRKKKLFRGIINLCFEKLTDVNIIDPATNGCTLLMIVCIFYSDDLYFIDYFDKIIVIGEDLNIGVDLNIQDNSGYTALMYLVESNDIPISKELLRNYNINLENNDGDTILDIALRSQNIESINLLLEDNRLNKTSRLLNSAILSENIKIVKSLINKNFPINNLNLKKYINSNNFNNEYKKEISNLLTKK